MANNASDATSVITSEETNDEASDVQGVLAEIPQMETTPFTHVLCQKEASNSYEMGEKNVVLSDVEDTSGNQNAHQVFDKISMSVNSQQQSQHVELGKPLEDSRNQATESAHHLPNEAHLRKQCKKRCLKSWKFKFKDDGGKKKRMRHSKVESWKRSLSLLKKEDELKTAYLKKIEEMAVMNGSSADDVTNLQIISKEHKELILSTGESGFMMGERAHLLLMTKTTLKSCITMLARVHTNSANEVRLSNWERLIRYSVLPSLNMDNNGIVSLSAHEIAIGWYDAKGETENWEEAQVSKEGSIQTKVSNFLLEPCLNILSQQSLRSWKFKFQSCNLLEATCVKLEWRYNGVAIHGKLVRHGIVSNEYSSYGVSSYGGAGVLITDFSGKEDCKDSAWMVQKLEQLHIFNISEVAPSDEKSPNVKNNTVAYQVFNRILHKEHNFQQKRTKVKGFKSWKFTFKSSYEEELFQHQWRMKQRDVHSRSVCAHKLQFLLLVLEDKLFFNRRSSVKFLREYFKKFNRETDVTIHYQPCKHARTEIQDVFGSLPRPPEGFGSEKAAQSATGKHHVLKHRLRV